MWNFFSYHQVNILIKYRLYRVTIFKSICDRSVNIILLPGLTRKKWLPYSYKFCILLFGLGLALFLHTLVYQLL
jgi:hypothetical protein